MKISGSKTRLLTISFIIVILFFIVYRFRSCLSSQEKATIPPDSIPPVSKSRDENGHLISIIKSYEGQFGEYKHVIDSLSRALRVKPKQIKEIDRYIIVTDTVLVAGVEYSNTADSVVVSKKDGYIDLLVVGKDSGDAYIRLKHIDTLNRTTISRTPLFGKPYAEVYLRSASPYNSIQSGSSFQIRSPRPILTFGPTFGYDILRNNFIFGVSVQFPLFYVFNK